MENLFVGYRKNGVLYGCKDYISNTKETLKADEMMKEFFKMNQSDNMKQLLSMISWKELGEYRRENNGFSFMIFLSENSIEKYAEYCKRIAKFLRGKNKYKIHLYDPLSFEERSGKMFVIFKNYGIVYHESQFEMTYIIDLDNDTLIIEDMQNQTKEIITR